MILGVTSAADLLHAYLIEGDTSAARARVRDMLERDLCITTTGNPDFHDIAADTLTIDEARSLTVRASSRALGDSPKLFLIAFGSATDEAQNALLKLFEEPTSRTHFFVCVERAAAVLPTLRSRLHHIVIRDDAQETSALAADFLRATPARRLALVKDIIDAKDKAAAVALLRDVERLRYRNTPVARMSAYERTLLRELGELLRHLTIRSPSVKLVLEYAAVRL